MTELDLIRQGVKNVRGRLAHELSQTAEKYTVTRRSLQSKIDALDSALVGADELQAEMKKDAGK